MRGAVRGHFRTNRAWTNQEQTTATQKQLLTSEAKTVTSSQGSSGSLDSSTSLQRNVF
jgi:hypothetical protein